MYRTLIIIVVTGLFLFQMTITSWGQTLHRPVHGTLFGWEHQVRIMILDQYNGYGGPEYDRGLFRHTTMDMNTEHDIDLRTYDFSPFDHYSWYYHTDEGFRTYFGSLDLGAFTVKSETVNSVDLGSGFTLPLYFQKNFDRRQDRALMITGMKYEIANHHRIGFGHTITEHKADLDATFYYQLGRHETGFIRLDATFLDWANRFIIALSEKRERGYRHRREYLIQPYYFSISAATPVWNHLRAEMMGGIVTLSEFESGEYKTPLENVINRNQANYSGLLVEYARNSVTAGLTWQHTFSRFSRISVHEEATDYVDYGNRQNQQTIGAYASLRWRNLHFQNWISRTYFRDTQYDIYERPRFEYPFDYEEHRYFFKNRLKYRPASRGVITGLEYNADYRDMFHSFYNPFLDLIMDGYDYRIYYDNQVKPRKERLTFIAGYQFTRQTFIIGCLSLEITRNPESGSGVTIGESKHFDGGFARLVIIW